MKRTLKFILPLVLLVAGAIVVVANLYRLQDAVVRRTLSVLRQSTGAEISFERLQGDLRRHLEFWGVRAVLPGGDSLQCDRIDVAYDLGQLLRGKYAIARLEVVTPQVYVAADRPAGGGGAGTTRLAIGRVSVVQGALFLAEQLRADSISLVGALELDSGRVRAGITGAAVRLRSPELTVRDLSGNVVMAGDRIRVEGASIRTGRSRARFDLNADLGKNELAVEHLELTGEAGEWFELARRAGLAVPDNAPGRNVELAAKVEVNGAMRLRLQPSGGQATAGLQSADGELRVAVNGVKVSGGDFPLEGASGSGRLRASGTRLDVDLATADSGLGRVELAGWLDWNDSSYSLNVNLADFSPPALVDRVPVLQPARKYMDAGARVAGSVQLAGQGLRRADAALDLQGFGLPFDNLRLAAGYSEHALEVTRCEVRKLSGSVQVVELTGRFDRAGLDAQVQVSDVGLDYLQQLLGGDEIGFAAEGAVSGQARALGSYAGPAVSGEFRTGPAAVSARSREADQTVGVAALRVGFELRGDTTGSSPSIAGTRLIPVRLEIDATRPAYSGMKLEELRLRLDQNRFRTDAGLPSGVNLAAAGSWRLAPQVGMDTQVAVVCSSFTVRNSQVLFDAEQAFAVTATRGTVVLKGLASRLAGGHLCLDGAARPGGLPEISLRAEDVDLRQLGQVLGLRDSFAGRLSLAVNRPEAGGAGDGRWEYEGVLSAAGIVLGGFALELDELGGRLLVNHSELEVDNFRLVNGRDTSRLAGSVAWGGVGPASLLRNPRAAALNLHALLKNPGVWLLHPVLKPTLDVRTGTIYADLSLTGTVGSPQLGGQARVYSGSLYLPDISQTITDINGQFLFDRNTINIGKVSGRSGGGEVSAWGRVFLDGLGLVKDLGLTIRTSSVEFRLANDVAAIGSGELDLRWATGKIVSVAGTMLVDEALIASEFGGEGGGGPKVNGDSLTLDLKLTADRNIWFRNRLTDLELAGELAVRINRQGLFVLGQLASRQGRVYAFDHTFRVTEGVLRFDNPTRVDPGLDITAELPSRIRGLRTGDTSSAKILLNLTGVASRPILTLGSDPAGISETDIGSYLATNITREELNQRMDRETFNHLVSDRLLNLASREVTSRLQRYLELDVLELKTPSLTSGAGLKITVGKYVGKNLFFSYTANTTQLAPEEFKVEYFITSGQEVVGARTETGAYSLKWQLKFRY